MKKNVKNNKGVNTSKLNLTLTLPLEMVGSSDAFIELVANKGVKVEVAKNMLSFEACLRKDCDLIGPETPVVCELLELSGNDENTFDILQLFYGIYSCQELSEEIEFSPDEIIKAITKAVEKHGVEEIIKNRQKVVDFLPSFGSDMTEFIECYCGEPSSDLVDVIRDLLKNSEYNEERQAAY